MKNLLLIIGLVLSGMAYGQTQWIYDTLWTSHPTFNDIIALDYDTIDSTFTHVDSICLERGHVMGGVCITTDMFCESYIIDYPDFTVEVYPACNYITYRCQRCGKVIEEQEPERRVVIWRREKPKEKLEEIPEAIQMPPYFEYRPPIFNGWEYEYPDEPEWFNLPLDNDTILFVP